MALVAVAGAGTAMACSSEDDATPVSAADAGAGNRNEGGAPVPVDEEEDSGPSTCPPSAPITPASIDEQLPWKAPRPIEARCTQKEIDDLKALFKSAPGKVPPEDIRTTLGSTCSECVFSPLTGAGSDHWQVFVEKPQGFIDNATNSCLAQISSAACGKAASQYFACLQIACPTECGAAGSTQAKSCQQAALKGPCSETDSAFKTACPNLGTDIASCGTYVQTIVMSCAGGRDGGIDASSK